jgi:hypothetical protein
VNSGNNTIARNELTNNIANENVDNAGNTGAVISDDAFIFDDGFTESNNLDSDVTEDELLFNDEIENEGFTETDQPPTGLRVLEQIAEPNLFAGAPPIPGTMKILAQSEAPEDYRVQPGDTLFDIVIS